MTNFGRKKVESRSRPVTPPTGFIAPRTHSFFKLYNSGHCSEELLIPPPFLKHFKGGIPNRMKLKNLWGRTWGVTLNADSEGRIYLKQGWERYVVDHSIASGDFLVFELIEKSVFFVRIYGPNAGMKDEPLDSSPIPTARKNKRHTGVACSSSADQEEAVDSKILQFTKNLKIHNRNCVGVPKFVLDSCNYTLPQDVILRNGNNYMTTQLRELTDHRIVLGFEGLIAFWKKANAVAGDVLQFETVLGKDRELREFHVKILAKAIK